MTVINGEHAQSPILAARKRENIEIAGEIVRHRRASRWIHWSVAITFFLALFTGMPIWHPMFRWMANIVGGLEPARVIHPYVSSLFFILSVVQFFHWMGDMHFADNEKGAWTPKELMKYLRWEDEPATEGGKYNPGQKFFFWAVSLGALGFVVSGIVMWFPLAFPPIVREIAILIHDIVFICFLVAIIMHIYLGTVAEPGTFRSMTRGTVTRSWARLHHPGWFKQVTKP